MPDKYAKMRGGGGGSSKSTRKKRRVEARQPRRWVVPDKGMKQTGIRGLATGVGKGIEAITSPPMGGLMREGKKAAERVAKEAVRRGKKK